MRRIKRDEFDRILIWVTDLYLEGQRDRSHDSTRAPNQPHRNRVTVSSRQSMHLPAHHLQTNAPCTAQGHGAQSIAQSAGHPRIERKDGPSEVSIKILSR